MSVALPTVLLLALLLPAIAFRRFYYTGEFSKQYFSENFGQLLLRVGTLALVVHGVAYLGLVALGSPVARGYDVLVAYLTGEAAAGRPTVPGALGFAGFQVGLVAAGAALGFACQHVVVEAKWDRANKLLRFANYWHYVLRGGIRDFRGARDVLRARGGKIDYTFVDVLVETSEGDVLYDGIVLDYELLPDNRLDKLVLARTQRRYLRRDRQPHDALVPDTRYYRVSGDVFVIPAHTIKNVNVRYITEISTQRGDIELTDGDGDISSADYYNFPTP